MNELSSVGSAAAYGSGSQVVGSSSSSNIITGIHRHQQQANLSGSDSREAAVKLAATLAALIASQQNLAAAGAHLRGATGVIGQPEASRIVAAAAESTTTATTTSALDSRHQEHALIVKDLVAEFVNLNALRNMIAQNVVEFLLVCVIISYLIFYFSFISRRPKLVGDPKSKFVQFISNNLRDSLGARFNPLVYFWGTNPQTALFGYLQGKSSLHEMPRNKFKRQYIYVSDAQYLTSNVNLSQHYAQSNKRYLLQLQVDEETRLRKLQYEHEQRYASPESCGQPTGFNASNMHQLEQNIRFHMEMSAAGQQKNQASPVVEGGREKRQLFSAASSESSSDSGVFGGPSSGSSSSSTSSLAAGTTGASVDEEDEPDEECQQQQQQQQQQVPSKNQTKCSCKARYKSQPTRHHPLMFNSANLLNNNGQKSTHSIRREELEFGQCAIDWHKSSHKFYHTNKLVALISAGMTTGSDKKYVTDTVTTLKNLGYEVCVFIRRGVGGLKLSSSKFFSPAKWRDFEAAVLSVRQQRPDARVVAIGFSFGSIELCRYLSMKGRGSLVDAALLISCPFDPEAGGRNMRKRVINRRIDAYLAVNLGKQLYHSIFSNSSTTNLTTTVTGGPQQHQLTNHNGSLVDLRHLPKIKSLVDFEDNFNRVIQNYPNSEAYAADSRLQDHLIHIETPTLCLSSEDDFMAPLKLLPLKEIEQNKNLCMVLTKRGGHMAFIDGLVWPKRPYFAQRIIEKFMGALRYSLPPSDDEVNTCPPEVVTNRPQVT